LSALPNHCIRVTVPVSALGTAQRPFALTTREWGTFTIRLRITFNDGSTCFEAHKLPFAQ